MSTVKFTLRGIIPFAIVGIWRSDDVQNGSANNPIYLGRPPSYSHIENIHGYVGNVLIRVRQKLYYPIELTASLQEPETDVTVTMVRDQIINPQPEKPALPEFVEALRAWLIEQGNDVRSNEPPEDGQTMADAHLYDYYLIHIVKDTCVVVLECLLYVVNCPSIEVGKREDMPVEWCDPDMFTKVQQSIDNKFRILQQKPIWVI